MNTQNDLPIEPIFLGARDAARVLSVSERTLSELTARGDVPSTKLSGRRLYHVATLRRWAETLINPTLATTTESEAPHE